MSKKNNDEPKEEVSEHLSEWQKRNKEYLEKKAQEEASKQKELEEEEVKEAEDSIEGGEIAEETEEDDSSYEEEETEYLEDESSESELETELSEKERKKLEKLQKKAEKEAAKVHISRIHIYRALPVLLGSGLIFIMSVYFLTPLATMKTIKFSGNQMVSQEDLLKSSKIDEKDYTLTTFINGGNHIRNMKASSPWINNLEMAYQFPITFQVKVKEYGVLAYLHEGGQYYPILTNGEIISDPTAVDSMPETHISIEFSDKKLIKEFALQIEKVPASIKKNIKTVQLTPSKVTPDLVTLTMHDGNKILVPISHIAKKLPYYKGIQSQLEEGVPSVVDMEAGIFSYVEGAQNEPSSSDEEKQKTEEDPTGQQTEQAAGQVTESQEEEPAEPQNSTENPVNTENR
ncbi:Cell division protein DivIB [Streptococcus sanguinis]|uniref:Cell division protein DivIB n=1 Tax=Streptococcus sanguinis TaxID=1305 RepID=A0AB74DPA3_STRSA|nr:FtsQ-type POTRA domain-containing protein [Streptococcus sanguinis]RSI12932.1 Cell division protein DivIB [Streptococcus sanguinis]RSI47139.1 Cell division protein DivIB [Streptococcus sanguinis]RSI51833.1 Cell division protein DivIB [Streptococcus sanguinis]RSI68379.1 Cell division protein DivIB [Streptococcus sanguinis]